MIRYSFLALKSLKHTIIKPYFLYFGLKLMLIFLFSLVFMGNGYIFAACLTKKDRNYAWKEERRENFGLV